LCCVYVVLAPQKSYGRILVELDITYRRADCCGADCHYGNIEGEPCWGKVELMDEVAVGDEYLWLHACQGHADVYCGDGPYKPVPTVGLDDGDVQP
jgi:hypothetical protein